MLTKEEIRNRWEEAYIRFETPQEEIKKFKERLRKLGAAEWQRDARIVDIFCGRGNGLKALEQLGFSNLEGVDISRDLLGRYSGPAKLIEADCRELPFDDNSRDIIIVQGGLHHLPSLPADLEHTLSEVGRVLKPTGRFIMVEPWETRFLKLIHFMSERTLIKTMSRKFDAFATMTHYEADTYFRWLRAPESIRRVLDEHFMTERATIQFGKFFFIGIPRKR